MTSTSLDFSRRSELATHAIIVAAIGAAAAPLGIEPLVTGAFARDLHLLYGRGIAPRRETVDLDLALAVPDWDAFAALRAGLLATRDFSEVPGTARHRLRFRGMLPVDLVPFGPVESQERTIAWPPRGSVVMDVFGYREALATAWSVMLPGGTTAKVVSLPALVLLKLVCWQDRHYASPGKDAQDIVLVLRHYLDAGNTERLFAEFSDWTREDDFDYELAGARLLGVDMRPMLDETGMHRIGMLLSEQTDPEAPGALPAEMMPADTVRARQLLDAMLGGMMERWST